jgi:peptidoglycan hydrolase-like protein with peptidoglycan-binding domain
VTVGVVAAGAIVAGAGTVAATRGGADDPPAPKSSETAGVKRQTLTSAETRDGTTGYADETTLRSAAQGIVTGLTKSGATVRRGHILYRVNQQPTVLMYGRIPAYRAMSSGAEGADVRQLERNLDALGYTGFTVDDTYTSGTAAAVRDWQENLGVDETGVVDLGAVDFQPGRLRMGASVVQIGDSVQPGADIADVSGSSEAVTVSLEEVDRDLAKVGDRATVDLGGDALKGKVTDVDAIPGTDQEGEATTTYDVTIRLGKARTKKLASLPVGASVDVGFDAETAEDVLTVPVKALLALAEGGHGVEILTSGSSQIVAVDTGLFADGWVEVSSEQLAEGDKVVVAP